MTTNVHGRGGAEMFWAEISPCEHLVQFYDADNVCLDTLQGFVAGGLTSGEAVIVIVTPVHLAAWDQRLADSGVDIVRAQMQDQYIPLEAEETLTRFMKDGWPDDERLFWPCPRIAPTR